MKPRLLVLALSAALAFGCTTLDSPRQAMHVEPVQSIRHGAPNAVAYHQLGRYYQGQNRLAQAEEAYLKAIAVDGRQVNAMSSLANLYAQRGELERATRMFAQALAMAPDTAYLHNNLGYALSLQGRLDEAYGAVRKALSLDPTFERAWVNLGQIADTRADVALVAAVRARQLAALPTTLPALPMAGDPAPQSLLARVTGLSTPASPENPRRTAAGIIRRADAAPERASASAASVAGNDSLAVQNGDGRIAGGRFTVVVANREVESHGEAIRIANAASPSRSDSGDRELRMAAVRLEVSNGNGVGRFARDFSARLEGENMPVTRVTNHGVRETTLIEYQPGYEAAARALMERMLPAARCIAATRPRAGTDIRIVLGRDALQLV